jgi:hypothetical protein
MNSRDTSESASSERQIGIPGIPGGRAPRRGGKHDDGDTVGRNSVQLWLNGPKAHESEHKTHTNTIAMIRSHKSHQDDRHEHAQNIDV